MMYDDLIKRLKNNRHPNGLKSQAADAIEELQAAKCPHYIRNVHDRGDDSLCDKFVCEVKSLPKWIPVTERLPEERCDYLVFAVGGAWRQISSIEIAYWDGDRFLVQSFNAATHWMLLPEPPKDGET